MRSATPTIVGWLTLACSVATAQSIHFDVSPQASCQAIVDEEFSATVPNEQLIEVRCQVSVLATDLRRESLSECLFHFFSPEPHTRVHDYFPKTRLATDIVGSLHVQQDQEDSAGAQLHVGSHIEPAVQLDATGGGNRRHAYSLSYDRLPPMEALTAVGTLSRGAGVYFKQKRSTQTSLEGSREFVLVLRVPAGWRAGYLRLVCQARATSDGRSERLAASSSFLLPLYLAGDAEAKGAAIQLHQTEQQLLFQSQRQHAALRRASRPTVIHELSLADPVIPSDWLNQVIRSPAAAAPLPFESRLPDTLRQLVAEYHQIKVNLAAWSGVPLPSASPAFAVTSNDATEDVEGTKTVVNEVTND